MTEGYFLNKLLTKGFEPINSDERFFEGYLTVEMKDKQGEVTIVNELYKVLPVWMDRGAPITDTHSNRVIGKGINFAKADFTAQDGETYPAIKVTGKIFKNYDLDNEIWTKIKSGEYKGLSFGGATKANRTPMRMKDGSIAYALSSLEHYEVAVCKDPAVPLAVITDYNPLAKSVLHTEKRGDKMIVKTCDNFGCFITKPMPDGNGGKGNFEHCVSVNQDKRDPSAFCGQIKHDTEDSNKADHSNTQGDQHAMYNQNTGRETWIGQGLPQPKEQECKQTVEGEGKCQEKPIDDAGGRAKPNHSDIKWVDDSPAGVPKNVKDESKQDRKGKHEEKKAFFEYLYADLKKVEEGQFGAGQRGLGHDGGSKQGSGQSAQITPVKVEVEVTSPVKEKEKIPKSI